MDFTIDSNFNNYINKNKMLSTVKKLIVFWYLVYSPILSETFSLINVV